MKKIKILVAAALCAVCLASCSTTYPVAVTANPVGNKCGVASSIKVFGIGGSSNTGINKAAKKAGITRISHVDRTYSNVLMIYQKNSTYVYGE